MSRENSHATTGEPPWVVKIVARYLLEVHGGTQDDLARSSGLSRRTVSRAVNGAASNATLGKLAAGAGAEPWELDGLLALSRGIHTRREAPPHEQARLRERGLRLAASTGLADAVEAHVASLVDRYAARRTPQIPRFVSREQAVALWARLRPYPTQQRFDLIEEVAEFQSWGLAELLCDESLAAAPAAPHEALELADLALRIAALSPPDAGSQEGQLGYACAHRGHALRATGDLDGAEEALRTARTLWRKGSNASLPGEERLLSFEAALRETRKGASQAPRVLPLFS
jgi:transcriptional regulator with XRE-family HTH domain